MDKYIKKINKLIEYLTVRVGRILRERYFNYNNQIIKYIFEKTSSDTLIVVFSSCTRKGIKARYNYIRTLKHFKVNKLFILDDLGEDGRGSYYLGTYPTFKYEFATYELIKKYIDTENIKRVYFVGSSKGGWAAMHFGLKFNDNKGAGIIVGAPQFFLGKYVSNGHNPYTYEVIKGMGNDCEVINYLDELLTCDIKMNSSLKKQNIYIHYSDKEHTYNEHVIYLLKCLHENHYIVYEDRHQYENHSDVGLYFSKYLKDTMYTLLNIDGAHF